jgi:sialate O-acetylesterase
MRSWRSTGAKSRPGEQCGNPVMGAYVAAMKSPLLLFLGFVSLSCLADVRLPRIFGDHMILQQQTSAAIWGWADPGEKVQVTASWGATAKGRADGDGRWRLRLQTPGYGSGHSIRVNSIEIRDVAIGEVWLCAGQSNMGWSVTNTFSAAEAEVDLPKLRIFKSAREHWHEPLEENRDELARWKRCDADSAAETSAVSYFFAKTLHEVLGVPVGIVQCAYAGTPIEGWMPWEIQTQDARAQGHKTALDDIAQRRIARGDTHEAALAKFARELAAYRGKIAAGQTMKNAVRSLTPPIITTPADLGHQYPAHVYNAMIHPIIGYGIRGFLWYQGERNAKDAAHAQHYENQLTQLIGHYRTLWGAELPFYFTQLPSWNPPQTQPVEGVEASWAVSREAMRLVSESVPNTGMAVSIDTGDAVELHPKNKKPIGVRHAYLALARTYGRNIVDTGPRFRRQTVAGPHIWLEFDALGSGLMPAQLDSFAIAGTDRVWHWAAAEVVGERLRLSSEAVPKPVAVRYAWAMNPSKRKLLYNKEGLPASPFRTDNWPLFEPGAEIVTVHKPAKPKDYVARDWSRPAMHMRPANRENDGLAPEITDLNAEDISWAKEKNIPDLARPYISVAPQDEGDGIPVGALGERPAIRKFAAEIADGAHGEVDSLLIMHRGKLCFESYYRRGRANYPHYQMSITKSYTAMAIGRAMQLGYLNMADLERPVVSFLKELQVDKLVAGAEQIRLGQALNMHSGVRIDPDVAKKLMRTPQALRGQGQIQAYLSHSAPIPEKPEFKYQGADPSMAMQVLEAVVPGRAGGFIAKELLGRMRITNFAWQDDVSGLPKSAAGSSMRSRDMLKWGMLVMSGGKWEGQQLIPEAFVTRATQRLWTNPQGTAYGYFWWRHDMEVNGRKLDCMSGRGAGGQFILMLPELELIVVITAHNEGMGDMLGTVPKALLPSFM